MPKIIWCQLLCRSLAVLWSFTTLVHTGQKKKWKFCLVSKIIQWFGMQSAGSTSYGQAIQWTAMWNYVEPPVMGGTSDCFLVLHWWNVTKVFVSVCVHVYVGWTKTHKCISHPEQNICQYDTEPLQLDIPDTKYERYNWLACYFITDKFLFLFWPV